MGLFDFFKGVSGGGKMVDQYMEEARDMHRKTGKPMDECLAEVMNCNK